MVNLLVFAACIASVEHQRVNALTSSDFFTYGIDAGDRKFSPADDAFQYNRFLYGFYMYNQRFHTEHVTTNGLITMTSTTNPFIRTRQTFENAQIGDHQFGFAQILPFYANVDTSGSGWGGDIHYKLSRNSMDPVMQEVDRKIHELCVHESSFRSKSIIVVTWSSVGYYNRRRDRRNSFQCVVATNSTQTFAFFLYAKINWVRADGQEHLAQIGFDSGDRTRFYRLPNTSTEVGIKNLVNTSNTGTRGMWAFKISYSQHEIKPLKCTKHTGVAVTVTPETAVYEGLPLKLTCAASTREVEFGWRIDGITWKGSSTHPGILAELLLLDNTTLQFVEIPLSANGSEVSCFAVVNPDRHNDHRRVKNSTEVTLTFKGVYIVPRLEALFYCPSTFHISWGIPINYSLSDTFCVSITDNISSAVRHKKCEINKTTYSYTAPGQENVDCQHAHSITVYAVNSAGEGRPATIVLSGSPPPTTTTATTQRVQTPRTQRVTTAMSGPGTTDDPEQGSRRQVIIGLSGAIPAIILIIGCVVATVIVIFYWKRVAAIDSIESLHFTTPTATTSDNSSSGSSDSDSNYFPTFFI